MPGSCDDKATKTAIFYSALTATVSSGQVVNTMEQMMRKKIVLYAYTRMNVGDDLFIHILCGRYPRTMFFVFEDEQFTKALRNIGNLTIISESSMTSKNRQVSLKPTETKATLEREIRGNCDGVVLIGGSLFQHHDKWREQKEWYMSLLLDHKPLYFIGINFGPSSDNEFLQAYLPLFSSAKDVCFRERYSFDCFSFLPNVRYGTDVAFLHKPEPDSGSGTHILISVISLEQRRGLEQYQGIYSGKFLELARCFAEKGHIVRLMGFCESEGDGDAIAYICSKLSEHEKQRIIPYCYSGDLDEALKIIRESRCVIGSRFHAMILGWLYSKPVYPVVYNEKSIHVMEDLGFEGDYTRIEDISSVNAEALALRILASKPFDADSAVSAAARQFEGLDKLLKRDGPLKSILCKAVAKLGLRLRPGQDPA